METTTIRMSMLALVLVVVVGSTGRAEEKKKEKKNRLPAIAADVVKVEIGRGYDRHGGTSVAFTTIEDKKKIAELLAFFPELGQDAEVAGGWGGRGYRITCLREKGDTFLIHARWDLRCWSGVGFGDWPLKHPDKFEKLMDSLLKKK